MWQFLTQLTPGTVFVLALPPMFMRIIWSRSGLNLRSVICGKDEVLDGLFLPKDTSKTTYF